MTAPPMRSLRSRHSAREFSSARQSFFQDTAPDEEGPQLEQRLRQQLARELHDGPVQLVSNATMSLMVLQKQLERNPLTAKQELGTAIATMQHAIEQMRELLFELRPMVLENEGLVRALEEYVTHLRKTSRLEIDLDVNVAGASLSPALETNIYYIIQEAVQNTLKHARATRLQIRLTCFDNALHVSVRDDGRGFDLERVRGEYKTRQSLGMVNLYERAEMIQGHLALDSLPGRGTTVRLTVPLEGKTD